MWTIPIDKPQPWNKSAKQRAALAVRSAPWRPSSVVSGSQLQSERQLQADINSGVTAATGVNGSTSFSLQVRKVHLLRSTLVAVLRPAVYYHSPHML